MFQDRSFGRRRPDPEPERPPFPWRGRPTEFGCNLAFADLVANLPAWLAGRDNRVHGPTLLVAAGAVAGLAAGLATIAGMADGLLDGSDYREMVLADGRRMTSGRAFHDMLWATDDARIPHAVGSTLMLEAERRGVGWGTISTGAFSTDIWSRIGTAEEGWPTAPAEHRPAMSARDLLPLVWPRARVVLTQSYPDKPGPCGPASVHLWPAVTAQAARVLFAQTAAAVPPHIGVVIALQSAAWAARQEPWPFDPELCRRRDAGLRAFDA